MQTCMLSVDLVNGEDSKQIKQLGMSHTVIHWVKQQLFLNGTI